MGGVNNVPIFLHLQQKNLCDHDLNPTFYTNAHTSKTKQHYKNYKVIVVANLFNSHGAENASPTCTSRREAVERATAPHKNK